MSPIRTVSHRTFILQQLFSQMKNIFSSLSDLADGHLEFKEYYLLFVLILSVLYAAIMHPTDSWNLACGFIFLLIFPAMYILLPFYAVANIVDTAWGTRDQVNNIF